MIEKDSDWLSGHLRQERTESARRLHENRHIAAKLQRIFDADPNWGSKNPDLSYEPLATARANGLVSIKAHRVDPKFLRTANRSAPTRRNESPHHAFLKSIGKAFLYSKTYGPVVEEHRDGGYRFDLAAPDDHCILECGNGYLLAWLSRAGPWQQHETG